MQRGQSFTVLPWPRLLKTEESIIAAEVTGRVRARQTGFMEQLSGALSMRLVFYPPPSPIDTNLTELLVKIWPYLKGVLHTIDVQPNEITTFTAVWGCVYSGGKVEVFIEEIDSY